MTVVILFYALKRFADQFQNAASALRALFGEGSPSSPDHWEDTRNFGNLETYPEKDKTKNKIEIFNVANVSATGDHLHEDDPRVVLQKNNSRWHTDSSYRYYPALFSVLYGKEVLPKNAKGGQPEFSNMLLAYESLSKEKKHLTSIALGWCGLVWLCFHV